MKWKFLVLIAIIMVHCKPATKLVEQKQEQVSEFKIISLNKTPCFGRCATYKIDIYSSGLAILDAKDFLSVKRGIYYSTVDHAILTRLKALHINTDWSKVNKSYIMNIPDLPVAELSLFFKDSLKNKSIRSNTEATPEVESLIQELNELAKSEKWTMVLKKDDIIDPNIIQESLQVNIDTSKSIESLEMAFETYGLKHIKRISQFMNFWEMTYDNNKVDKYEILVFLSRYPGVYSVKFNRRLELRE